MAEMTLASAFDETLHWLPRLPPGALNHIPGEKGLPIVGTTLRQLRDPVGYINRMVAKYGPVFRTNIFGVANISLLGPDANELMLFDRDRVFSSEQGWGPVLNLLFPRGLMLMDFDQHRLHRRTLSVAFKPEPMMRYAAALNDGISVRVASWSSRDIKFYPEIKKLTLDLAATSFLGVPLGPAASKINQSFADMVAASVGVIRKPWPGTLMHKGVAGRKFLIDFFGKEIPKRRESNSGDMFTQICHATHEDGSLLTNMEVIDHLNFLMMAAHDTITSSITSTVSLLAANPAWQDKLRAEMLGLGLNGDALPYERLNDLVLTEYVFKESLRLSPPVPSIPRRAVKDFNFKGFHIPAGAGVSLNPNYTHMMPEYWPNPAAFDPMRFVPELVRERHKYAWVPFGGGAHMCLGLHFAYMQAKIFFYHLLTTHRIVIAPGYKPSWQVWPIPRPKDGLPVRFEKL
jgi:cytochrome P450